MQRLMGFAWLFIAAASCPALAQETRPTADASQPAAASTSVKIEVDTSDTPALEEYGRKVQALAEEWYPKIVAAFPSDGYTAPDRVNIRFRKDYKGVAAASGSRIVCAEKWFTEHPEDLGAIIHELVHVVQRYRRGGHPGWLVEGIADHYRFFSYEPEDQRPKPNPDRARHDASYRTSAAFLDWAQRTHNPDLVVTLNTVCREGRYSPEIWKELTGHDLDELGNDWKASLRQNTP